MPEIHEDAKPFADVVSLPHSTRSIARERKHERHRRPAIQSSGVGAVKLRRNDARSNARIRRVSALEQARVEQPVAHGA
jgi:hypothetical protein